MQDTLYVILNSTVTRFRDLVGAPNAPRWNAVLFNGLLTSLFCSLQFLSAPLLGVLSDRYGRRPMLLVTTVRPAAPCAHLMPCNRKSIESSLSSDLSVAVLKIYI